MWPNAFDFLIIAVLLFFIATNASRGMKEDLLGIPGALISFIIGLKAMKIVGGMMAKILPMPRYVCYAFALIVAVTGFILFIKFLVELAEKSLNPEIVKMIFKIGGGIFGFIKGALVLSIILIAVVLLPLGKKFENSQNSSRLLQPMKRFAPATLSAINRFAPEAENFFEKMVDDIENWGKSKENKSE